MEVKEPHSVSLKVLRLSRPSLGQQQPLPPSTLVDPRAALSNPLTSTDGSFTLSPMLTLPPTFGSAYVGEAFDCTLCVNNELAETASRKVTSVRMAAEIQTPSQTAPLELDPANEEAAKTGLEVGDSIQSIIHFDLREDGSHTLIVSLTYNESIQSKEEHVVSGGRIRSFRKLYQFMVGPCLSVRTKASDIRPSTTSSISSSSSTITIKPRLDRYALEAQLENLADGTITIEKLLFEPREPFRATSLNWDRDHGSKQSPTLSLLVDHQPTMAQRDVTQVAFLIEEKGHDEGQEEGEKGSDGPARARSPVRKELTRDGRTILGVLTIYWRSEMGQAGVLSTGWLTTRKK